MTIEEAATYLQEGAFTSVDLTQAYLARIEEAKEFNAVIEINPDALEIARKLDEERCQGINRG
jgi:amidase